MLFFQNQILKGSYRLVLVLILFTFCIKITAQKVEFTPKEQEWIKNHPVIEFGYEPMWLPFEIYKDGEFYTQYNYNPLSTNPKYLSSTAMWIISKKRNPDWIRHNENRFTIFGWKKNEDEREDHQKQKHIIKYGIKKNVKGKTFHLLASHPTPPVFDGDEDRNGKRNHDEVRLIADYINIRATQICIASSGITKTPEHQQRNHLLGHHG